MGAQKLQRQRAGAIRRVVRVSGQFVCGICRNAHDDLQDARGCLDRCWDDFLHLTPVIVRKSGDRVQHRCRFCARDYDVRGLAQQCADQCKQKLMRKVAAEARLADREDSIPVKRPIRAPGTVRAVTRVVMPAVPARRKPELRVVSEDRPELRELVDDAVTTITADANEKAVEPAVSVEAAAPAAVPDGKKKKPAEVFYRDQAKYVCTVCHEKYFTKVEVTKCYDSHD